MEQHDRFQQPLKLSQLAHRCATICHQVCHKITGAAATVQTCSKQALNTCLSLQRSSLSCMQGIPYLQSESAAVPAAHSKSSTKAANATKHASYPSVNNHTMTPKSRPIQLLRSKSGTADALHAKDANKQTRLCGGKSNAPLLTAA